jgi:GAF domain-containing protein
VKGIEVIGGVPQGAITFCLSDVRDFATEEKELMTLLADSVAIALERSRAEHIFPAA